MSARETRETLIAIGLWIGIALALTVILALATPWMARFFIWYSEWVFK